MINETMTTKYPGQSEDEAQWAEDRELRAVQRAERARVAKLPIGEQQAVFIRLLGELGSIQEVCEFMGVSRYIAAKWRRANPDVATAVHESNEAAYDMLESWLHDYGRGYLKSGPGQVETQWRLFYFRHKHLVGDEGKITIRVVYDGGESRSGVEIQLPAPGPGLKELGDGN